MSLVVPLFSETTGWTVDIDGRRYRPALIDSDGHLQVDVLSSALPSGAATAAKQTTMITALQKIDDLQNALFSVGGDELRVFVISSVLPSGAATFGQQSTMITALEKIDDLQRALDSIRLDRLNVNVYRDGASEVKSIRKPTASDATIRATIVTPTSGKKIRLISCGCGSVNATATFFEVYFGTGATIGVNNAKAVMQPLVNKDVLPVHNVSWPDGGGPVGAVDEVLSLRCSSDVDASGMVIVHYREE